MTILTDATTDKALMLGTMAGLIVMYYLTKDPVFADIMKIAVLGVITVLTFRTQFVNKDKE